MIRAGSRERFSLEFELREDPDVGGDPAFRASWGAFAVWVRGRNLTRGRALDEGPIHDVALVPLLPVGQWIVASWDYLLHEERLPRPTRSLSAASWRADGLQRLPTEPAALDPYLEDREEWWLRHGLGAALPGFRVPDLHIRRYGHDVELSWDDREWRSVEGGVQLVEQPGAAYLPIGNVAEVLHGFVGRLVKALAQADVAAAAVATERLRTALDDLTAPERQQRRLEVASGVEVERAARRLRTLAGVRDGTVDDTVRALLGLHGDAPPVSPLYAVLTPPVLLYRSMAPSLSPRDLLELLTIAREVAGKPEGLLKELREPSGTARTPEGITQDGYERALWFRESLGIPLQQALVAEHDLEKRVLARLGVLVRDVRLDDRGVDGAAVLQPGAGALIAINRSGKFARTRWGRRMTLAHELCHLLCDGEVGSPVGVVSNPWASYPLERRANAFAAMLLMPEPALAALLPRDPESWTRADLNGAMQALEVGLTALTWHLRNLGWITESERMAWIEEFTSS